MGKRLAVVTGAATGIGKAISQRLLLDGYEVAGMDLNDAQLKVTEQELAVHGRFFGIEADVTDESQVTVGIAAIYQEAGHIDALVNNAGGSMGVSQAIELISIEEWDKVINVNLRSTFICAKAVIPYMKKNQWGRIVNISSLAGRSRSYFGGVPYASAKAGIIGFTRQGSKELGPFGITMNAVAPGVVISGERISNYWYNKKTEEERQGFLNLVPVGRTGNNEDVSEVVSFLCSEKNSYITGAVIDVNGGFWVG